jgi:broad-specificity NMP kinase
MSFINLVKNLFSPTTKAKVENVAEVAVPVAKEVHEAFNEIKQATTKEEKVAEIVEAVQEIAEEVKKAKAKKQATKQAVPKQSATKQHAPKQITKKTK